MKRREFINTLGMGTFALASNKTSFLHSRNKPSISDLVHLSASQLAHLIHERKVSSIKVIEAHLRHIELHNPALNAIVTLDHDRALSRAKQADEALSNGEIWGPLHGVPITIKDAIETAGLRTTCGLKALSNYIPKEDATVVKRLKAAGAIILGKTNTPELAGDFQCNSPLLGRGNNPWNLDHATGGSSGGGAAAVAACLTPVDIGSDAGGSIRIPAHYCGVFGIKHTENLVSTAGHIPEEPGRLRGTRHLNCIGPMARSIEDIMLILPIIAGPDGRMWEVPPVPLKKAPRRQLKDIRLAWTDDLGGLPITNNTRSTLSRLVQKLSNNVRQIERLFPEGLDFQMMKNCAYNIWQAEAGSTMSPDELEKRGPLFKVTMHRYTEILTNRDICITAMENCLKKFDALLWPVTVSPAIAHQPTGQPIYIEGQKIAYMDAGNAFTFGLNATGNPVVVIPVGLSNDGLPIGVQVIGRRWGDMELLRVAEALTEVTGPFRRPPGY